ncbi:MAG: DUF1704 domain-containing protein [Polyangiaceae bacterium]
MPRAATPAATLSLLDRARAAFAGGGNLLDAIAWPRSVERAFFAANAEKLPEPPPRPPSPALEARLARLEALQAELKGSDALEELLRARAHSHVIGTRLALAAGTKAFGALSREAYGGARTTWLDADTSNLDFAEHLAARLGPGASASRSPAARDRAAPLDAEGLGKYVAERVEKLGASAPPVEIVVDEDVSAKAIAGKTRLRIRKDASFEAEEARSLFLHEVETHLFTAQNGAEQPHLDFLDSGGPLATQTQEGLAVFAELYAQAITLQRLRRLVTRVRLVAMAEDGASFLDVYRHLLASDPENPKACYLDAARIFRGGLVEGGAPFTKDAVYLSGLVEVYDFLRVAVAEDHEDICETLVTGRIALPEVRWLVALRDEGLVAPPRYRPSWLRRWDDLVAHFAFSSFLAEIDLQTVRKRNRWIDVRKSAGIPAPGA